MRSSVTAAICTLLASLALLLGLRAQQRIQTVAMLLADATTAEEADALCAVLGDLPFEILDVRRLARAGGFGLLVALFSGPPAPIDHSNGRIGRVLGFVIGHDSTILSGAKRDSKVSRAP